MEPLLRVSPNEFHTMQRLVFSVEPAIEILPDEIYGLIGPNGSGKTAFLREIIYRFYADEIHQDSTGEFVYSTLLSPEAGSIDVLTQKQKHNFSQEFVIEELVARCENAGLSRSRTNDEVEEVASRFDLWPLLGKKISHLSSGELQRLALACLSQSQAKLILIDEPSSFLDSDYRSLVAKTISDLKESSGERSFLVTGHDEQEIRTLMAPLDFTQVYRITPRRDKVIRDWMCLVEDMSRADYFMPVEKSASPGRIKIEELHLYRDGTEIVSTESPEFRSDEVCLLVGENGSGKSTILEALAGLEYQGSFQITLDGEKISAEKFPRPERRIAFQDPPRNLICETIQSDLQLCLDSRRQTPWSAESLRIFEGATDLDPASDPSELSFGEQRMLSLLCLLHKKEVLLLDEPDVSLDLNNRVAMNSLMNLLNQASTFVIIATNRPELYNRFDKIEWRI